MTIHPYSIFFKTMNTSTLNLFHPLIGQWFDQNIGSPTDVQIQTWPVISRGDHVLMIAPTGSGKTLAAFLWAIDRLMTGAWETGKIRVVYVSPLKALNNDIRKNLSMPLAGIRRLFINNGLKSPDIAVMTRSGDTPQVDRRRMIRLPPDILITTPESLNLMISTSHASTLFSGVETVILDEIHAIVAGKRGTHLITAVDRLIPICGEFQRIALSATVRPAQTVADFVAGYRMTGGLKDPSYEKRRITIIRSESTKAYDVRVRFPEDDEKDPDRSVSIWPALVRLFKPMVFENRSTLFFANSRRTTEKITRLMNDGAPEPVAYSHHGSLSKEIRLAVEKKLKSGQLKAIVATSSLELGIDIGRLDQVALVGSPPTIASALQRVGRSGHGVGQVSRGEIFPTHGRDLVDAAVSARSILDQDIEPLKPVQAPLDVLAQIVSAMTASQVWHIDDLFAFLKTSYPYHCLTRRQFDLVIDMLEGRYAQTRIRELTPRVSIDRIDQTISARPGSRLLVFTAGGTIADRGYFDLRLEDTGTKIGELDEEFVWERRIGETFALGAQTWKIRRITHNDVRVIPFGAAPGIIPFWRAEFRSRDFHFTQKIGKFLEHANAAIRESEDDYIRHLLEHHFMDSSATKALLDFLKLQMDVTKTDLPHRHHLLIEHFDDPLNRSDSKQVILHTLWGGRINRPYALAMSSAWEQRYQYPLEVYADDDAILLLLPHDFNTHDVLDLVDAGRIDGLLRTKLEQSGIFGARFRECAGVSLLLPRAGFKKRMPLWLNRVRSKKLMEAVMQFPDFPILLETWRTCLNDDFDLENLKRMLDEIADGTIRIGHAVTTSVSPFGSGMIWQQTNEYMYRDDTPAGRQKSALSQELISEIISSSRLRPRIDDGLTRMLDEKLKRTAPGYAPGTPADLLDWVKERLWIPEAEWKELLAAAERDHGISKLDLINPIREKLAAMQVKNDTGMGICALENLARAAACLGTGGDDILVSQVQVTDEKAGLEPDKMHRFYQRVDQALKKAKADRSENHDDTVDFMGQWLMFYGPIEKQVMIEKLGIDPVILESVLETLVENQRIIVDVFRRDSDRIEVCDRDNLEILLRMERRSRLPAFEPLDAEYLPLFMADFQGIVKRGSNPDTLQQRLDQLFGFPAPAGAWETDILPARIEGYRTEWLDRVIQTHGVVWFGCAKETVSFAFFEDLELFVTSGKKTGADISHIFPHEQGKYGFYDMLRHTGMASSDLSDTLWRLCWKTRVTNDAFETLRKGILNKFTALAPDQMTPRSSRRQFNRWKSTRPVSGNWYLLPVVREPDDPLEEDERVRDRIRQLLRRHGILFRELTERELTPLRWGKLFRTLRLMELSGEILSGHFFKGIHSYQFMSREGFRRLKRGLPEDAVYWMNAADPASACGLPVKALKKILPPRRPTTHVVFTGARPVVVSRKKGKELEIQIKPDHPLLEKCLTVFREMLTRNFNPARVVTVKTINGIPAAASGYEKVFMNAGFSKDFNDLELRRYVD